MTFGDLTSFHQNKIFAPVCFTRGAWPAFHEIGNSKATLLKWPKMGFSRNNRFFRVRLLLLAKCSVILLIFEVKFSFPLFFSIEFWSRQKFCYCRTKWLIREAPDHLKLIEIKRHCKLQIWLELCWRKKTKKAHYSKSPYFVQKSSKNLDFWHENPLKITFLGWPGWLTFFRLEWVEFYR